MDSGLGVLITTFFMVLIMEMGDKSQLLVMALASKYRPFQVFLGICTSILFLNILAVLLGSAIGGIKIIQDCVRAGASILFIFFGIITLKDDDAENEKNKTRSKNIFITIALTFFLAEFGDKTQLSTFSFAALYPDTPISVFTGSTLGLLASDCMGLLAGALIVKYIPKRVITHVSAFLFIAFGLLSEWVTLRHHFLINIKASLIILSITILICAAISFLLFVPSYRNKYE